MGFGLSQVIMGSALYPLFRDVIFHANKDVAWQAVLLVPARFGFIIAFVIFFACDDEPTPKNALQAEMIDAEDG